MTDDILKRAEELLGPLHLPLEWDDDYGGIVTQELETEYGECGEVLGKYKMPFIDCGGKDDEKKIIDLINILPAVLAEARRLEENNRYLQTMIDEAHGIMNETQLALAYEVGQSTHWKAIAERERARFNALPINFDQLPDVASPPYLRTDDGVLIDMSKQGLLEQAARELESEAHLPIAPHGIVERNENPTIEMTPERQEAFGVALERLAATATDDKYISNPWMIGRVEQAIEILREMLGGEQPRKWKNEGRRPLLDPGARGTMST